MIRSLLNTTLLASVLVGCGQDCPDPYPQGYGNTVYHQIELLPSKTILEQTPNPTYTHTTTTTTTTTSTHKYASNQPTTQTPHQTPKPLKISINLEELTGLLNPRSLEANGIRAELITTQDTRGGTTTNYGQAIVISSTGSPNELHMPVRIGPKYGGTIEITDDQISRILNGTHIPWEEARIIFSPTNELDKGLAYLPKDGDAITLGGYNLHSN